jgi:hypothetical protein
MLTPHAESKDDTTVCDLSRIASYKLSQLRLHIAYVNNENHAVVDTKTCWNELFPRLNQHSDGGQNNSLTDEEILGPNTGGIVVTCPSVLADTKSRAGNNDDAGGIATDLVLPTPDTLDSGTNTSDGGSE